MGTSRLQFALWLAYRISRFVFLLSVVFILLTAASPPYVSLGDWGHYWVKLGVVTRIYRTSGGCGTGAFGESLILWLWVLVSGVATAFFWTTSLPTAPDDACDACGYNLTGNTSGRCPECGTAVFGHRATDVTDEHR